MSTKIVVGPIKGGFRNDVLPFNINNDSFPKLVNAYQWRDRIKRKRGTSLLGRLTRVISTTTLTEQGSGTHTIIPDLLADSAINLRATEPNAQIKPKTLVMTLGTAIFSDTLGTGVLTLTGVGGVSGSVEYNTGVINLLTLFNSTGLAITAAFSYFPCLPVMGLEDFDALNNEFPFTIAFDTVYSYNINVNYPHAITQVNYYKNPLTGAFPGYTQKASGTTFKNNSQDYRQYWSLNYQGGMFATSGLNIPFNGSASKLGMQFKLITGVVINAVGPPALATLTIVAHGLVQGDFVFLNEVQGITGINFQTGYVVSADPQAANTIQVEFPNATLGGAYTSGGIAQYLTNSSDATLDCMRWYDGNPNFGLSGQGWVNFCPPLSQSVYSVAEQPALQWYLVSARMIFSFKDRLLFIGPVIENSSGTGSLVYLQDTVIYSQNGTPYYTCSFTGIVNSATTVFTPILVPTNQTATPSAWFEDNQSAFGGFISAGIDEPIATASTNEDAIIMGFTTLQSRFIYTGNNLIPFNFYLINSELGSTSTFSGINFDLGVMTVGSRGFILTGQTEAKRIDLEIPDEIFQFNLSNNGRERVTAQRDFINEWIYFTYNDNEWKSKFPNQTLQYNYRDDSWATFVESYTHYGSFQQQTGQTWATLTVGTWSKWNSPWNSGNQTLFQPRVIAGNQQGFVMFRDEGTEESTSLFIVSFSGKTVTSPDHGLNVGDFIVISGATGTISTFVNGKIFQIFNVTSNTFDIFFTQTTQTYFGSGVITRMYKPFIQTKQFPTGWEMSKKTRIGVQRYLLSKTNKGQVTLLIYLNENDDDPFNDGPIIPDINSVNPALIYSTILYTCPETSNLGLTPANYNLQMPTSNGPQKQIWHRMNTSLVGDTVQVAFTLSDIQMSDPEFNNQFVEIELHNMILEVSPSGELA